MLRKIAVLANKRLVESKIIVETFNCSIFWLFKKHITASYFLKKGMVNKQGMENWATTELADLATGACRMNLRHLS